MKNGERTDNFMNQDKMIDWIKGKKNIKSVERNQGKKERKKEQTNKQARKQKAKEKIYWQLKHNIYCNQ